MRIVVIGAGAAGFFAAIRAAEVGPEHTVTILEATREPLSKVRISGGGRCNVTHHCFDPAELIGNYPRGQKELRGPFATFQPSDTVAFFERQGIRLKTEADGRMFPITDSSETIIDCLLSVARARGVDLQLEKRVTAISRAGASESHSFAIGLARGDSIFADRVMLATGSSRQGYRLAESLGHSIVPCVPSLFTFKIQDERLRDLAGISFDTVELRLETESKPDYRAVGPLLITHWGVSGPAVLKLSAFAARPLHDCRYHATLHVNFLGSESIETAYDALVNHKQRYARRQIRTSSPHALPKRYWARIAAKSGVSETNIWANCAKSVMQRMAQELTEASFAISGKGIFKEEFVTAGGIALTEIDFRTMQSRVCPGLYAGGEILDIDGVTGGFNFQSAWTTGWIAGSHMVRFDTT